MIANKKILLGVTASIAAYKAALLVRLLIKNHMEVKVVMTESAKSFITPLTLSTLSKNPVYSIYHNHDTGEWHNHVDLALWADLILIAPATANEIGKMANGLCDNLLTTIYLSAKCPVMVCPAMDLDMYLHPSVQQNLAKLVSYGNLVIDAKTGELASGLIGQGRMAEPEEILEEVKVLFESEKKLLGKKVLLTVGPTKEAIDPVRFISNHSSGKMGMALAKSLLQQGAEVFVITSLKALKYDQKNLHFLFANSAEEMLAACQKLFSTIDVAIFAAAIADYRPLNFISQKIKKDEQTLTLELIKNPDIALTFGNQKRENQFSIGFALETNDEEENAEQKLLKKNMDMVVLNSMNDTNATFGFDTNKITLLKKNGDKIKFELKSKTEVANDITKELIKMLI
jgi:phosphopantothenoylcysteine decarboxylase / phosphopantothenate---cysteine ligase